MKHSSDRPNSSHTAFMETCRLIFRTWTKDDVALAVGLWLAALAAKYRDVLFAVNFLLQVLMYASPVIYSGSVVPERLRFFYRLNPMTGVVEGFRWALLGNRDPPGGAFWVSVGVILVGLVSGAYVFRRTERTIVDIL